MEFADETPNLIPVVRIHLIGTGSRNDVRRAVLKAKRTCLASWPTVFSDSYRSIAPAC